MRRLFIFTLLIVLSLVPLAWWWGLTQWHAAHIQGDSPMHTDDHLPSDKPAFTEYGRSLPPNTSLERAIFAAGCFWGVEEAFRAHPGVVATQVGYTGGHTTAPTYEEVCSDRTGHAEAVLVLFNPEAVRYADLLDLFWTVHNPTQRNRQGPDVGTQYRSAIFTHNDSQQETALASRARLAANGRHAQPIATEICPAQAFYPAETYHQQYIEKRGGGSCHY